MALRENEASLVESIVDHKTPVDKTTQQKSDLRVLRRVIALAEDPTIHTLDLSQF